MTPIARTIYRWSEGRVEALEAPLQIRSCVLDAGPAQPAAIDLIDDAIAVVARVAPWVTCYFTPQLYRLAPPGNTAEAPCEPAGQRSEPLCGTAWVGQSTVAVDYSVETSLIATTYHEIFHALEPQLPSAVQDRVRGAAGAARRYRGAYADAPIERAARLFEHFAEYLDEGGTILWPAPLDPARSVHEALYWIYRGDFARWRADQAAARAAEAAKRARRARRWAAVRQLIGV